MFRRVQSTITATTGAAAAVTARRTIVVFSQQHHILESNQKARGSPSNVWVEDWEVDRLGLTPEEGALPTQLLLDKQLELFNFDQIITPPEVMEAPRNSSYFSRKPYGEKLQFELNDRAQKHNFQSKWWITKSQAFKENLQLKNNARASVVLTKGNLKLFHTSQLTGGEAMMQFPVSGGSRKPYNAKGEAFAVLQEHIKTNDFNSGLYFTRRQLDFFKLAVEPSAQPVLQEMSSGERYLIFNVDQLEDPSVALKTLQRSPVSVPTFLLSGEPIQHESAKKFPKTFKSNYWLTGRDAELYQWPIREAERRKGVAFQQGGSAPLQIELYNVEQLTNPEEAFAKAGLFVQ